MGENHACQIERVIKEAEDKIASHLNEKHIYDIVQKMS